VARYDGVIPPGGTGEITLQIDTSRIRGEFQKKAIVWSNDPEIRSIALYLKGEVKPHISIEPGGYVSFWGVKGQIASAHLDIANNNKIPLKIVGIDNDLPERIKFHLREIRAGYVFRIEIEDISETAGDYTGHLIIRTNNRQQPELIIIINGQISE
jgi:hypothetical protein